MVLCVAVRELIEPKARDINHVAAHWKSALNAFAQVGDLQWLRLRRLDVLSA